MRPSTIREDNAHRKSIQERRNAANARLVEANRELLEVLERCADFMGSVAHGGRGPAKVSATFVQAYKDARAVIAKTTGETQCH